MPTADNATLSILEAYHQAWTSGDVDRASAYVSDDRLGYVPPDRRSA
jgi:hypothetical protein